MVEECGILSNLLFHFVANYHIYYQALPSFPGVAWPGLELLLAPSTYKTRHASFSGWGKMSVASDAPWFTGLNSIVESTSVIGCVCPGCLEPRGVLPLTLCWGKRVRRVCVQIWPWPWLYWLQCSGPQSCVLADSQWLHSLMPAGADRGLDLA